MAGPLISVRRIGSAALAALFVYPCQLAGGSTEPPSSSFMAEALRLQLAGPSIELDYTLSFIGENRSAPVNYHYVRSKTFQYILTRPAAGFISYSLEAHVLRKLVVSGPGKTSGLIHGFKRFGKELGSHQLPDPILMNFAAGDLIDLIKDGTTAPLPETVDGIACWRVTIQPTDGPGKGHTYKIWLDSAHGYIPLKIYEKARDMENLVHVRALKDMGNGIWYPTEWDGEIGYGQEAPNRWKVKVTAVSDISQAEIEALDTSFPAGTEVKDMLLNADYIQP